MDMLPVEVATAERVRLGTDEITVLTTSEQSHGDLFSALVRMPPGAGPPLMHRHTPSEVYHVLEGEFTFYLTDPAGTTRRHTAAAGAVVPLAGGTPHTIRNESTAGAMAFVVHAPGTAMEAFTKAAAALAADGDPAIEDVLAVAQAHGIELLGPVPTPR